MLYCVLSVAAVQSSEPFEITEAIEMVRWGYVHLYAVFKKSKPLELLPRDATQSAVLLWQVVCPSVCP